VDGRCYRRGDPELRPVPLDPRRPHKPLDVGNGIVAGTLAPNGRWLSLGIAHPVHGRIVLTTAPAFVAERGDQRAVRAYRASLADPDRPTFGLDALDHEASSALLVDDAFPMAVVERPEGRLEATTVAPSGRSGAVQVVRIKAHQAFAGPILSGTMRLARAEYTQLTLGGALPPAPSENRSGTTDEVFWIDDRLLDAAIAIALSAPGRIEVSGESRAIVAIAIGRTKGQVTAEVRALVGEGERLASREIDERARLWAVTSMTGDEARPSRRAVAYALDCAATRVDAAVAVLADHEILPLVWTRDAYYVCRALLALDHPRHPGMAAVVEGFARWLFERAERVDGWWPRASLASGQAKDPAFQLDQQLWPLLLVLDHARLTRDPSMHERYAGAIAETLVALLAKRTAFGLIATAETPADDPLVQPYHFSSHVLLWRVLAAAGHRAAGEVRDAILRHFTSAGRFAYAVAGPDGAGARHYHDANDLPTVFAPGWGFCSADDARWRATIAFAWSDANEGYFSGELSGLGSLHTPHPWPLGDLQAIIVARVIADPAREGRARERLARVETWDGLLPEAYDEETGAVASRHWFAWPASLRALLEREPMLTAP
jgi:uncharacterized protein